MNEASSCLEVKTGEVEQMNAQCVVCVVQQETNDHTTAVLTLREKTTSKVSLWTSSSVAAIFTSVTRKILGNRSHVLFR